MNEVSVYERIWISNATYEVTLRWNIQRTHSYRTLNCCSYWNVLHFPTYWHFRFAEYFKTSASPSMCRKMNNLIQFHIFVYECVSVCGWHKTKNYEESLRCQTSAKFMNLCDSFRSLIISLFCIFMPFQMSRIIQNLKINLSEI